MEAVLHYTGSTLDRADHLRRDKDRIESLWAEQSTIVIPLFELKNLIDQTTDSAVVLSRLELGEICEHYQQRTFLGLQNDQAVFCVMCDEAQAGEWLAIDTGFQFVDLRAIGPRLSREHAQVLAYARGISHWQSQTLFCTYCGADLLIENAGHVARCQSADCARQWFPRTDPAVIMLVERVDDNGEHVCLLGRSPAWPKQVYSTLAGFVETGESLEQAVAREVLEESGVVVENVRYVDSQPWPFPQSIMLGFIATAVTEPITIDPDELAEAHWFSAASLDSFGNWGDESEGPKLPRPDSIARYLIEQWRASVQD